MIEQIYNDFTTQLLPKIAEGLIITKDYFFDFFGRYVKYLIIIDSMALSLGIIFCSISIVVANKSWTSFKKRQKWSEKAYNNERVIEHFGLILSVVVFFMGFTIIINSVPSLIKDLTVPEVRVYEKLKDFKTN